MTPPSVTPQGAQLKRYDIYWTPDRAAMNEEEVGGTWCKYTEAAEWIEKLERALADALRDAERWRTFIAQWDSFTILNHMRSTSFIQTIDAARQPEKDANNGLL